MAIARKFGLAILPRRASCLVSRITSITCSSQAARSASFVP